MILNFIVSSMFWGLCLGHIFEMLFQGNYEKNGKAAIAFLIDPIILMITALYYGFIVGLHWTLRLLWFEFALHMIHFWLIYRQKGKLYRDGKRPRWYSILFNTVDIFCIFPTLFIIANLYSPNFAVSYHITGSVLVLALYKITGRY